MKTSDAQWAPLSTDPDPPQTPMSEVELERFGKGVRRVLQKSRKGSPQDPPPSEYLAAVVASQREEEEWLAIAVAIASGSGLDGGPTAFPSFPMPSPNPDLALAARKIEELSTDHGSALTTIATAILRLVTRIGQLEDANAGLARRLQELEKAQEASRGRDDFLVSGSLIIPTEHAP